MTEHAWNVETDASVQVNVNAEETRGRSVSRNEENGTHGDHAEQEVTETSALLGSNHVESASRHRLNRSRSYMEQTESIGRSLLRSSGRPLSFLGERISQQLSPARPSFPSSISAWPQPRQRSHRSASAYDEQTFQDDLVARDIGNGVRVWYESYTTIDWIHDAIKESSRLRRLREFKGIRGAARNAWDRFQGWLVVSIIGVLTAFIAGGVVQSEAVLFDFKEGYCERDWRLAKRFCCPYANHPDYDKGSVALAAAGAPGLQTPRWSYKSAFAGTRINPSGSGMASLMSNGIGTGFGGSMLAGWAGPVAGSPAWKKVAVGAGAGAVNASRSAATTMLGALRIDPSSENESCPGWVTWSHAFKIDGKEGWIFEHGIYLVIAILWATIASLLTIYLTSSELYLAPKSPAVDASKPSTRSGTHGAQGDHARDDTGNGHSAAAYSINGYGAIDDAPARDLADVGNTTALPPKLLSQIAQEQRAAGALPPRKVLYFGSGSGISEIKVILSGFVIHGYLGFWTLFTKAVGLTLSVASGLSLGKEGPFVHMASCVGNIVCRMFDKFHKNEGKRREMLSCACAAGVAVAFGAPVGGVLFSLEEVSSYFPAKVMFRSFFCAMVAAATLRAIDPFGTGKIVLFQVTYDKDWHSHELVFFVLIGIFGGLYGAVFTKLNMMWTKNVRAKSWMARRPVLEIVLITIITLIASFFNGYMKMGGAELIADLFSECHEHESLDGLCVATPSQIRPLIGSLAYAMVAKGLLTVITFGIKLPAGIFIPTLAVGAAFGRIVGLLLQYTQWTQPDLPFFDFCSSTDSACIVPGVYAMIGAAAALSGVTRTTVSLVVIMFELTGTLTYSIPVMLSILIARTIADALEHKGIYDLVIDFSGLPYLDAKAEYIWSNVSVSDAMDTNVEVIRLDQDNTVSTLERKLARLALGLGYTDGGFPIVIPKAGGKLKMVGYIAAPELEHALQKLHQEAAGLDAETVECTFNNLAYLNVRQSDAVSPGGEGADADGEVGRMRDSMVFSPTFVQDPNDLSRFVDKAPISVQTHSPLELVHQYFTKLGVRYLVVNDDQGSYKGVIFKKRYLKFLEEVQAQAH
ncbi:hypothetical protein K437DRAFT_289989 [Tilletiaria anomala UBC 951]|uniref:Uncharacterized protein n=1 Tax=Tilletiaria anomala (strain ATCC 24038 / CBS 436.72 / UBC 951) TaxID=1037660 RepID=A0A066WF27_TILAU|nr:uncharacterized protein K437DRAFT_289989 [Tilletiaria anomala UBC 951]KDN52336.1 hypothetical protein K437DRAFT_289989 [Tilletiaria anomala UBC 951]